MFKRKDSKKKKRSRREAEGGRGPQEEQTLEELPHVWLPAPQEVRKIKEQQLIHSSPATP